MMGSAEPVRPREVLTLLADGRRRRLLGTLADGSGTTSVGELVTTIGDEDPERLRISLYHVHLPRLADLGIVEFDRDSGAVRYPADERVAARVEEAFAALDGS